MPCARCGAFYIPVCSDSLIGIPQGKIWLSLGPSQPQPMNRNERIILLLLAAINFTHIMDFMVMAPLGTYLMEYFDISEKEFSFLLAIYPIAAAVSAFSAAFFVDRFDRKSVLLAAYSGFILGTACCAFAPSYGFLVAARGFAGLFGGLIGAQVLAIVADTFSFERRATAMGAIMGAFSLASALGVPTGLYLATHFNWHGPFYAVAGMGLLLIPLTLRFLPAQQGHLDPSKAATRPKALDILLDIGRSKNQRIALALSGCLMMGHFLIIPFLNPFLEFNKGFSKTEVLFVYVVGGVTTLFSSPLLGKIADRWGKFKLFALMVGLSVAPIVLITNLPRLPLYSVLAITGVWFVISTGRGIPAQALVSAVVPPERRGGFMSFNSALQQLFTGAASLIAGFIVVQDKTTHAVRNYNWTGYLSLVILGLALIWGYRLNKSLGRPGGLWHPQYRKPRRRRAQK